VVEGGAQKAIRRGKMEYLSVFRNRPLLATLLLRREEER
jgi:hypothetical protein